MDWYVLGPPGCGKTTYLSRQIEKAAKTYLGNAVIVSSFTKAAAAELVSRDLPVPDSNVGTLHALCYRQLGCPTLTQSKIKEWNELHGSMYRMSNKNASVDDLMMDDASAETPGDDWLNAVSICRAKLYGPENWDHGLRSFYSKWQAWKKENEYFDFTDLIETVYNDCDHVPGNPKIGFFDEAQDFSQLEFALAKKWAGMLDKAVFAGDEDQLIYSFRGASPDGFLDSDPDRRKYLKQSYRLPRQVHEYSQRWIKQISNRIDKEFNPMDVEGCVDTLSVGYGFGHGRLLEKISEDIEKGESVMILATCSYMLRPIVSTLMADSIPFANRYRQKRADWNPLQKAKGQSTMDKLMGFLRPDEKSWGEYADLWSPSDLKSFVPLLDSDKCLKHGAKAYVKRMEESNISDFAPYYSIFNDDSMPAVSSLVSGGTTRELLDWFGDNMLKSKRSKRFDYLAAMAVKYGAKKFTETPSITIGTIHSIKGGEADNVYIFPDLSPQAMTEWNDKRTKDQIIRVFYVGFTRAKKRLVLCSRTNEAAVDFI